MTDAPARPRARPLSPHLQVWRWHVTMWASILHRMSGMALYGGALILAGWALSLAAGPEAYGAFKACLGSPLGKLVMFALTLAVFYHLASGIRHLVWDTGKGFALKTADSASVAVIAFTIAATLATWVVALMSGALA